MFNPTRAKVQLKLSVNRLQMLQNKKNMLAQQQRKEIARLLEIGKEESARIRVEHIIREDFSCEALEIIELYCELLLARFGLLEQLKNCDPAIIEAVNTVIYAAPRSEVKELLLVRDQLAAKFGREFVSNAMENKDESVNPRIIQKLKVQTPDPYLVNRYLEEIAKTFKVSWTADPEMDHQLIGNMDGGFIDPVNHSVESSGNLQRHKPNAIRKEQNTDMGVDRLDLLTDLENPSDILSKAPAIKPDIHPTQSASSVTPAASSVEDLDSLTRRFEALKKRS
ncbi:vacuolar protein sorting-associated protein IST1 [Entomortierella parvispora]|uniref:Vacuolar protein sorting-associated protein IST1 n=1 Tax=Entomortierella parvispora TaxID=205924 RepID=A0A9P3H5X2_9FUNG|nr:vacuolar protein sorting-associated protein IST1 [Entomortierella parvispora]